MSKQAKKKQTDYTIGGRDISNTAIPLYQANLQRMDNYLADPMAAQQKYQDAYYNANNVQNQDFLRGYQRAMGNTTANNYASTQGGYSSAGNRAYTDQQRYYNDLASRLQDYGVKSAYNMANQDYQNMLGANASYQNAYGLGKAYSDTEQYNDLVNQANKNWIGQGLSLVGNTLFGGTALGAGLDLAGNAMQTDISGGMASIYGGAPAYYNSGTDVFGSAIQNAGNVNWSNPLDLFKRNPAAATTQTANNASANNNANVLSSALQAATQSGIILP